MYKIIDLHCDTLTTALEKNKNLFENDLHIDIKRLNNFKGSIQVFAIWLSKKYYKNSFEYTNAVIDFYEDEIGKNNHIIEKIFSVNDIEKAKNLNKLGSILSIEGGESLIGDLKNVEYFYNRGVRILTLCWNYENHLGYGALEKGNLGLKDFGKQVVLKMNELGMIIDVSHLNEAGFWDVYNISKKPFIASHSNAYGVHNHVRNLKDDQIKAIAEKGGIIGINLYPYFLNGKQFAKIENIINHIDYISKLIGFDNISLGGDFDGIEITPNKINNILDYPLLFQEIEKKYGDLACEKICFENAYKFLTKNL